MNLTFSSYTRVYCSRYSTIITYSNAVTPDPTNNPTNNGLRPQMRKQLSSRVTPKFCLLALFRSGQSRPPYMTSKSFSSAQWTGPYTSSHDLVLVFH